MCEFQMYSTSDCLLLHETSIMYMFCLVLKNWPKTVCKGFPKRGEGDIPPPHIEPKDIPLLTTGSPCNTYLEYNKNA